jgi:F-type H+-transporting ATPase subunit b
VIVNWFIVLAQILNFLILVALLRWLLYRPVLGVIERRQRIVAGEFEQAQRLQAEARRQIDDHRRLQEEFQRRRQELLHEAEAEVEQQRHRRMAELRDELEQQRRRWLEELEAERESFLQQLRHQITHLVMGIARRALADLATVDLEQQVVHSFIDRLRRIDPGQRQRIGQVLERGQGTPEADVLVTTAFPLRQEQQEQIRAALRALFPAIGRVVCRRQESLSCGIVATLANQQIGWSLSGYLSDLEEEFFHPTRRPEQRHVPAIPQA